MVEQMTRIAEDGGCNTPYNPKEGEYAKLYEELQTLKKDKSKPLEIKEKDMQAIMERLEAKNKEDTDRINQKVELKNEEVTQLAKQLANVDKSNKAEINKITLLLKKAKEEAAVINNEKKEIPTPNVFAQLLKEEQDRS
ncbi:13465_t:CDS:2 [Entrophospora sp. SA101]|nr:9865_t:CDS:2 [Entrophospora sp. SA101]CAJ0841970.1 10698_t:CDS:2 [Entrophospora sp. SA101]CAJ0908606.1 13465_t:CDS:2 [Entrophospora sp. SA101]